VQSETMPEGKGDGGDLTPISQGQIRCALLTQPLTLSTVIPFALINAYGYSKGGSPGLSWPQIGYGALGWYVALLLRAPIVAIAHAAKMEPKTLQKVTILASGPCEEGIRALALWVWPGHHDFDRAFTLGLGWAAIEAVFTVIQGLAMVNLLGKNDEKAREARQKMVEFIGRDTAKDSPLWASVERVSANMVHISCTLVARLHPALAVPLAVAHSCVNYGIVSSVSRYGLAKCELVLLAFSATSFLAVFLATRPAQ